jgi:Ca2+-binding EF-hand superfamily protein
MLSKISASHIVACALAGAVMIHACPANADDMATFATGGYARGVQTESMMQNIDADHDGKITRREWLGYQEKVWKTLDKDASGVVNEKQFLTPSPEMVSFATGGYARGLQTREMMRKIDKDGDGTVSHDEFMSDQAALFDLMDTGKAGVLGPREFLDRQFP